MQRFKNILYILDAPPVQEARVTAIVQDLARSNDAAVRIVKLEEETVLESAGEYLPARLRQLIERKREYDAELLRQILADSGWRKIRTSGELLIGKDFIMAIRKVLEQGHDLVIKARRGTGASDRLAMRLFRKCPCPVWIIDGSTADPLTTVLAAVDLADRGPENRQLNNTIVELAMALARWGAGEAHFLHAWHLEYEKGTHGLRFEVDDKEIETIKRELVAARTEAFARLFEQTQVTPEADHIHLMENSAANAIRQQLLELHADVLVMGTVARTGLPGLLIGNKAEEVLSEVHGTVLAVKPAGFVSPVKPA